MYPEDYRYTKDHEWIKKEGSAAVIGITVFAQKELGDIVYVDLPAAGKKYQAGEPFGSIESVKAVSDIYAPIAMEVIAVNQEIIDKPETINSDAHGKGWLVKVQIQNEGDFDRLLKAEDYQKLISTE
jgi:glycine cleavage system H protein